MGFGAVGEDASAGGGVDAESFEAGLRVGVEEREGWVEGRCVAEEGDEVGLGECGKVGAFLHVPINKDHFRRVTPPGRC